MAVERKWLPAGPYALTAPGTQDGVLTLTSTLGLKVKQKISLTEATLPTLRLEIKRVVSATVIEVGPPGNINARQDVSAYNTTASVYAPEQDRATIPLQELERATYEEEPTVAWRVISVDPFGDLIDSANPLPVSITGSITVTTRRLTDDDNDPNPGDIHDAVRVGDGSGNYVKVNPDGSINVVPESSGAVLTVVSSYAEVTLVPNGVLTTVNSYVVPAGKTARLSRVDVNGTNISDYQLFLNGTIIDRRRTYFGDSLNDHFEFFDESQDGLLLAAGDNVTLKTIHGRPDTGDFGARIQVLLIG